MTKEDQILETLKNHDGKFDNMEKILKKHDEKFDGIEKILKKHDEILKEHDKKLKEHDERFDHIDETLDRINQILVLIQYDTSVRIPAIFDNCAFHQDHLVRHDNEIKDLQSKMENHSNRIISLEIDSKEHHKQLQKFVSNN